MTQARALPQLRPPSPLPLSPVQNLKSQGPWHVPSGTLTSRSLLPPGIPSFLVPPAQLRGCHSPVALMFWLICLTIPPRTHNKLLEQGRPSSFTHVTPAHHQVWPLTLRSPAVMFCSAPAAASVVCRLSSQRCSRRLYRPTIWGLHSHSMPLGSLDTSAKVRASAVRGSWTEGARVSQGQAVPCSRCSGPHPPLGAAGSAV